MAIDPLYIPLFTIEEVILDKDTGLPLSGGVVKFFRDSQRATPKDVFQISGSSPNYTFTDIGAVFTLGISGTFVDINGNPMVPYAYPFDADGLTDLYYVTVESAGGVPQFTRQAVPHIVETIIPPSELTNTENELCNSQFVEVNFPPGITTISVTGVNTVTQVAPGWDLITSGSGSVTFERLEPTAANVITNPPYALRINADSALGSSVTLRQRLNNTPSLARGGFVSATFTVAVLGGGSSALSMIYAPSTGTSTTLIPSTNVSTDGSYHSYFGNAAIPQQVNTAASTGYIDINLIIPTSRNLALTSLQIVGTTLGIDIPFDEQTADRQKDHLFHYYEDAAVHQPKSNLLTGWIFAQNPWQFRSTANANVPANQYTADQTIIVQQAYVDGAVGNNVSVAQGTAAQNFAYNVRAVTAANKFALIQYIDPSTIAPYWGRTLSVMLRGSLVLGAGHTTTPQFKVRLMYRSTLPAPTAQAVPVSSWTNIDNSIPGLAGWTFINSINDPTYTLTSTAQDFAFNGFVLPASSASTMTLGIMVFMLNNLDSTGTPDQLLFDEVSLVHSDFAVKASAETWDETQRKCQYYYESSYEYGVLPGTVTATGALVSLMVTSLNTGAGECYPAPFGFSYNTFKRAVPSVTLYNSATGTAGNVRSEAYTGGGLTAIANDTLATFWTVAANSTKNTNYVVTGAGAIVVGASAVNSSCIIRYHYVADARLGI